MVGLSLCLANAQDLRPLRTAREVCHNVYKTLRKTLYEPPQRRPQSYCSSIELIFYIIIY